MLPRVAPLLAFSFAAWTWQEAQADDRFGRNFNPRGAIIELTPSVAVCMPTAAADCKTSAGRIGPFVGGQFAVGFRPIRNIAIGVTYVGAALRPNFSLPTLKYSDFAHIHGVYAFVRPIYGWRRLDVGADVGAGWSYESFALSTPADTRLYSQGFSAILSPLLDVFLTRHFYIGAKATFLLNVHPKVCTASGGDTTCRKRDKGDDQFPVHEFLAGVHLGFVI